MAIFDVEVLVQARNSVAVFLFLLMLIANTGGCGVGRQTKGDDAMAFVDVTVVPMDSERTLESQTVIVRDGRIAEIGPASKIAVPPGAKRIDGRGKYLMPGLADMHTHLNSEAEMTLFVANGVTTVRNMAGAPYHLVWRERIAKGEILSPTIYTAGPIIDGYPPDKTFMVSVKTEQEAEQAVVEQKKRGYDFIKVYHRLTGQAYDAVLASAKRHQMPVAGHLTDSVELQEAFKTAQSSIEHLDGYTKALQAKDSPYRMADLTEFSLWLRSIDYVDEGKIPALAAATRDAGVWNCPTLVAYYQWGLTADEMREVLKRPEIKYLQPRWVASLSPDSQTELTDPADKFLSGKQAEQMKRRVAIHKKLTKALADAGVGILLGTDMYIVPGFWAIEELRMLVEAGLTSYQAIKAGTRDAAEYLKASDQFGTVTVGKRADLILVDANPLEDVANVARRDGVMIRGQWLPENRLRQMLDDLAASYKAPKGWFRDMPALPDEGKREFFGRYEIEFNGVPKGEERFAVEKLPNGRRVVVSQLATEEPVERYSMRLEMDDTRNVVSIESDGREGKGKIELTKADKKLQATGRLPVIGDVSFEENISPNVLLDAPGLASKVLLYQRLRSLAVNEAVELKIKEWDFGPAYTLGEKTLKVKRQPDGQKEGSTGSGSLRVYRVETVGNGKIIYKGTLTIDEQGIPVTLKIEQEDGVILYHRVQ
jgi:imidazolonepropionase-like amidohydrolase